MKIIDDSIEFVPLGEESEQFNKKTDSTINPVQASTGYLQGQL